MAKKKIKEIQEIKEKPPEIKKESTKANIYRR
jgi:hypothetical protein